MTQPLISHIQNPDLQRIADRILSSIRISPEEGLYLYEHADLSVLGMLADQCKKKKSGDLVYFNRNIHIEPTNICIYQCRFCAYSRKKDQPGSWEYSMDEIIAMIEPHISRNITEVHIVGGVHPDRDIHYYADMLRDIKKRYPHLHIKAFTAVELDHMIAKAGLSLEEGLALLKKSGLDSIPGGGAEIFDPDIRRILCSEKSTGEKWITVHKATHKTGLPSNATMLYGHIETYRQRINHLQKLRELQDETGGFNAFIPLKFRNANNEFSHIAEIPHIEDLRNYAVSRIYLDNFAHIKAYWPMIGKEIAQLALSFGADDIDGTIDDTTKIYSMAGVKEKNKLTVDEMLDLIRKAGKQPAERDSVYNVLKTF